MLIFLVSDSEDFDNQHQITLIWLRNNVDVNCLFDFCDVVSTFDSMIVPDENIYNL
jgi:hypothetical protein